MLIFFCFKKLADICSSSYTGGVYSLLNNPVDRFAVLEARDKYIRLKNPRSVTRSGQDIHRMNLVGTCPDLCSEKERYGRSAKNQLRCFEKENGVLNHMAAIKVSEGAWDVFSVVQS